MNEQRKYAYRWLLYHAMLEIRSIQWFGFKRYQRWNPFSWRRQSQQVRRAGAIADWLHNLAEFSAADFELFDEAWFWGEHQRVLRDYPGTDLEVYRSEFDRHATSREVAEHAASEG